MQSFSMFNCNHAKSHTLIIRSIPDSEITGRFLDHGLGKKHRHTFMHSDYNILNEIAGRFLDHNLGQNAGRFLFQIHKNYSKLGSHAST